MKAFALLVLLTVCVLMLHGCAHAPTMPKVVNIAVPVSCVPKDVGPAPQYPDTDDRLLGMDDGPDRYVLIAAGRILRNQRLAVVEPVLKSCR